MAVRCIYDIKLGMLQVRENEIPLRKWSSGATAQLRTLQEALIACLATGTQVLNHFQCTWLEAVS